MSTYTEAEDKFISLMQEEAIPVFKELSDIQIKLAKNEEAQQTLLDAVQYFMGFGLTNEAMYYEKTINTPLQMLRKSSP